MDLSFNKNLRIHKTCEYNFILKNGTYKDSLFWRANFIPNQKDDARLGLAISKKSYKNACDRNLVKRLAREAFRSKREEIAKLDIILRAKKSSKNNNTKLVNDLINLFKTISNK